jgi:hypothetical protein
MRGVATPVLIGTAGEVQARPYNTEMGVNNTRREREKGNMDK